MMLMMIESESDNIFIIGLLYGHRPEDTFVWGPRDDEVILRLLETATSFLLTWLRDRKRFEILNFACCQVVAFCSLISELFLIMYALESFFPMLVIFFNLYGDFNGKMAKFQFLAINCSRSVLHLSSYHY